MTWVQRTEEKYRNLCVEADSKKMTQIHITGGIGRWHHTTAKYNTKSNQKVFPFVCWMFGLPFDYYFNRLHQQLLYLLPLVSHESFYSTKSLNQGEKSEAKSETGKKLKSENWNIRGKKTNLHEYLWVWCSSPFFSLFCSYSIIYTERLMS